MCMIQETLERQEVIDYTLPTFINTHTIMSHSPKEKSKDFLFLAPFNRTLWMVTFTSFSLILVFLLLINLFHDRKKTKLFFIFYKLALSFTGWNNG